MTNKKKRRFPVKPNPVKKREKRKRRTVKRPNSSATSVNSQNFLPPCTYSRMTNGYYITANCHTKKKKPNV
jgi:hypothetical protein